MLLGIDIGGTFTDAFYIDDKGTKKEIKVLSSPEDMYVGGFLNSIKETAKTLSLTPKELLSGLNRLTHGSTIATNTVIEGTGAKVGVITTKGHKDVLKIMLGRGRVTGQPIDEIYNFLLPRPEPIVPNNLIIEVSERIDQEGTVLVKLNEKEVEEAVKVLLEQGVETLAICFLWSILNPTHEHTAKGIASKVKPDLFVSCSCDVAPMLGEYQRFTTAALNCLVQPKSSNYVGTVVDQLHEQYSELQSFFLMSCNKGIRSWEDLKEVPVYMIDSGPVGGLCAAEAAAKYLKKPNMIAIDMGGTSFDVGLIVNGTSLMKDYGVARQWEYAIPRCDIETLGAGGGSIVWVDPATKGLKVGPKSAGAHPGPACYGQGGIEATVSDADLLLGYLNPHIEISGHKLDHFKAEEAIGRLAFETGLTKTHTALGIFTIVNEIMGGRVKSEMIGRGLDYRQFWLLCYGGAGPIHMTEIAKVIGLKRCVIPANSSVFSASGLCSADFRIGCQKEVLYTEPWNPDQIQRDFVEMEKEASNQIKTSGKKDLTIRMERSFSMQFKGQFYQLTVPVPSKDLNGEDLSQIKNDFIKLYTSRYGDASSIPGAEVYICSIRTDCVGEVLKFETIPTPLSKDIPAGASLPSRKIYDKEVGGFIDAKVYKGENLVPGNKLEGPCMIDFIHTSIRLGQGERAQIDEKNYFIVDL